MNQERASLDAPPEHIDLDAFRAYRDRLGFGTSNHPQPDSDDELRNCNVIV